ncbi:MULTISPECIES: AAA family ATPase [Micrococcus]|uniref:Nuclease SbcCD subunit C n=4 Tax=Micrococcus TaxID=1269 RepID=A0ABR6D0C0_9MICC|nr:MULTISPECIES: SMC family ATPase [Micrococcus]MBA9058839.1 exonuclease SbcC [Micrococcus yunnanensis]MBU8762112.1 SMC family ATPase [Micrococcus luteus]MCT1810683.1 SMC family ATPase [Micrococcus luteus]MCT1815527.1 SMC family ATPase [Micrococcus luteus]MCV7457325.1 SMC family ATPase [Micrococcus luteus]
MRIHRMRLEGLGPYAQAQDVDFDRLNAGGLFLLDGPTGAGKSTVLAALCFALYGTVPGGRSAESLVTTLREPGAVIPEVQVEFTVQGRRFEVVRSPKHERPRRRRSAAGGATVTTQATVSLRERVDGEWTAPLTRADEVGQQIAAVLHLDAEQFMQVVLLPQGQFAQFLTAKSDERRVLLRRLFGTQRFDGVEEHLRVETARLDTAVAVDADVARTARAQLAEALHEALGPDWHAPEPSPDTDDRLLALAAERAGRAHEDARADLATARAAEQRARVTARELETRGRDLAAAEAWASRRRDHDAEAETAAARRRAVDAHERAGRVLAAAQRATAAADAAGTASETVTEALAHVEDEPTAAAWLAAARADGAADAPASRQALGEAERAAEAVARAVQDRARMGELEQEAAAAAERRAEIGRDRAALVESRPEREAAVAAHRAAVERGTERLGAREAVDRAVSEAAARRTAAEAAAARAVEAETAARAHREAQERRREAAERHVGLLRARYEQAASELAERLVPGEPCAVCGSPEHPAPAATADTTVTEADVRDAEQARTAADRAATDAETALRAAEQTLRTAREAAAGLAPEAAREALERAEAERAALDQAAKDLAADRRRLTAAEKTLAGADETAAALAAEDGRLAEAAAHRAARLTELRDAVEAARGDAETLDARRDQVTAARRVLAALAAAQDEDARARAVADETDQALTAALAEQRFDDVDAARAARLEETEAAARTAAVQEWHAERARLAELEASEPVRRGRALAEAGVEPPTEEQTRAAAEALAAAEAASSSRATAVGRLDSLVATVRRQSAALTEVLERSAGLIAEHTRVRGLLDLVRGGGENLLKMPLTSYVLAGRLEEVAAAATERLLAMTDQRYSIEYSDAVGGRGNKGLELVIRDHYVDETRHPATLSGGETFMASLALALGLADTVQAEAGGIELDTLFVDEGFGSLDADTLDDVLDVVDTLRTGGRTVGLVSHVERMRQEIGVRLEVRKDRRGSSLAVHDGA